MYFMLKWDGNFKFNNAYDTFAGFEKREFPFTFNNTQTLHILMCGFAVLFSLRIYKFVDISHQFAGGSCSTGVPHTT